jgi:uncharacterized protein
MADFPGRQGLHLMAKPVGPACNLGCRYCFYLEKAALYAPGTRFSMTDDVLRAYIRANIAQEPGPEVLFTWQGGEPALRGLDFYRRALSYQREFGGGKKIRNAFQTNGVLLDEEWCAFFAEAGFAVGISLDGPRALHDAGRRDKRGNSSFDAVMRAIALLKAFRVEFNVLVTVSNEVAHFPREVYRFLKEQQCRHIQFNPVVERVASSKQTAAGQHFAQPGPEKGAGVSPALTADSVTPISYGEFLIAIFDEWVRHDVGEVFVMNFEWALAAHLHLPSTVCLFAEICGSALVVEHNGDVYSCDHFVYPDYRLGNILDADVGVLGRSARQIAFGAAKSGSLPGYCRRCEFLAICNGECPKNRFATSSDGEPGLNYLCPSYRKYFGHISRYMAAMAKLIGCGQPASLIMEAVKGPLAVRVPAGASVS